MKEIIATAGAPAAIGPYSQAVAWGDLVFCSGQIALNPETGHLIDGGVAEQTARVIENLRAVLEAAGSGLGNVLKTTVFLKNMGDFGAMNEVYGRYFSESAPARATVEAARLPRDVQVEIEAIAFRTR
ncbi:MAG: RidA family protein [Bryobacteraceae bacterium]